MRRITPITQVEGASGLRGGFIKQLKWQLRVRLALLLSVLFMLWTANAYAACSCTDHCINRDYDLVAQLTVLAQDADLEGIYVGAHRARLDKLVVLGDLLVKNPEDYDVPDKLASGDVISIVASDIISSDSQSTLRSTQSPHVACLRTYQVGDKMLYFATKVEPMVYISDLCTCTVYLDESN